MNYKLIENHIDNPYFLRRYYAACKGRLWAFNQVLDGGYCLDSVADWVN